jgi:hypothetical protein
MDIIILCESIFTSTPAVTPLKHFQMVLLTIRKSTHCHLCTNDHRNSPKDLGGVRKTEYLYFKKKAEYRGFNFFKNDWTGFPL